MKKTTKKTLEQLNGPLSDEELQNHLKKQAIIRHINGNTSPLLTEHERLAREVLYYRSRKRLIITMDEHHSSMGTAAVACFTDEKGKKHQVMSGFPMSDLGFNIDRGQRFLVTVDLMTPDKKMKPRKNPFLMKARKRRG